MGQLAYLWDYLVSIAPLGRAVSWSELASWTQMTGITLHPWECQTIIMLSTVWSNETHRGGQPDQFIKDNWLDDIISEPGS